MEENQSNKSAALTGFIWRFLERCGAQIVTFIVSVVLARILEPTVYGTIALVTVFITIMQVFANSGFANALIQKKDADDLDFSTVFYFNIVSCSILYLIMFFSAPLIAKFYNDPTLIPIVRVLSLTLVIYGVQNVQQAYVSRNMQFKKFFFSTIGGTIGAAVVGIGMAYSGFGVWALVGQQIFKTLVGTIILWFVVSWRPKLMFSFSRLKGLFTFGWKILVATLIDTIYNDLRQLIIGKLYSPDDLAYYNKGKQLPYMLITNINLSIDSVLFPTMSKEQDNKARVKNVTRRSIQTSCYIIAPIMIGLAVCARPLVSLLLTDKWLSSVFYLQAFSIILIFYPIHTANLNAIKAMGRSDMFLKLELVKKIVGLILLISTMFISVEAMALSMFIGTISSSFINAFPNKKLLDYSWTEQMKDILPNIGLALLMGIPVFFIQFIPFPDIITKYSVIKNIIILILQVVAGASIYIGLSVWFKIPIFNYLLDTAKGFLKKK